MRSKRKKKGCMFLSSRRGAPRLQRLEFVGVCSARYLTPATNAKVKYPGTTQEFVVNGPGFGPQPLFHDSLNKHRLILVFQGYCENTELNMFDIRKEF